MFNKKYLSIGIDFGTTKTAISIYNPERDIRKVQFLHEKAGGVGEIKDNFTFFPSTVAIVKVKEKNIFNIDISKSAEGDDFVKPNFIFSKTKLDIGNIDFEVSARKLDIPKELSSIEPWHIAAIILKYSKNIIYNTLSKKDIKETFGVTITVPATWNPEQRRATILAAKKVGFKNIELLEEPIAALLGIEPQINQKQRIMVIDFGGGTCDAAVIDYSKKELKIIATSTIIFGGGDIDKILFNDFYNKFKAQLEFYGVDIYGSDDIKIYNYLIQRMEKIKESVNGQIKELKKSHEVVFSNITKYINSNIGNFDINFSNEGKNVYHEFIIKQIDGQNIPIKEFITEKVVNKFIDIIFCNLHKNDFEGLNRLSEINERDKFILKDFVNKFIELMDDEFNKYLSQHIFNYKINLPLIEKYVEISVFSKDDFSKFISKYPYLISIITPYLIDKEQDVYINLSKISSEEKLKIGEKTYNEIVEKKTQIPPFEYIMTPQIFKTIISSEKKINNETTVQDHFKNFVEEIVILGEGKGNIDLFYLVGGSSELCFVQEVLQEYFSNDFEKKYKPIDNPREKISLGAAVYQFRRQNKLKLFDRIHPFEIKIATNDNKGYVLIKENERIKDKNLTSKRKKFEIVTSDTSKKSEDNKENKLCSGVYITIHRKNDLDNLPIIKKILKFQKDVPYNTTIKVKAILRRDGILSIEAHFPSNKNPLVKDQFLNSCFMQEKFPIFPKEETSNAFTTTLNRNIENLNIQKTYRIHTKGEKYE